MKQFLMIVFLVIALQSIAFSGTPTGVVDTVSTDAITGKLKRFVKSWVITLSTTPDTLSTDGATQFEFIHKGAASGDTVYLSTAQSGRITKFTEMLVTTNESTSRDFHEPIIKRLIVKATGTIKVNVRVWR